MMAKELSVVLAEIAVLEWLSGLWVERWAWFAADLMSDKG